MVLSFQGHYLCPQEYTACGEVNFLTCGGKKVIYLHPSLKYLDLHLRSECKRLTNVRKIPPLDYVAKDDCEDLTKISKVLVTQGSFLEEPTDHLCTLWEVIPTIGAL